MTEFNFLGLLIDQNLSFDPHIHKVSNKISRTLGTLNKLKRFLPQQILTLLYNSLVLPHFQYAILCWGFKTSRLFKLQKKAMRIITVSKYNAHTDPLFKKLNIMKVEDIYRTSLLKFYFKFKNETVPHYFTNIFTTTAAHSYNTRGQNEPRHTLSRTSSAQKTVRNYMPVFLNTVPHCITSKLSTHSIDGFSQYAKKHYINLYKDVCFIQNCYVCGRN